jgi:hypothetical protein
MQRICIVAVASVLASLTVSSAQAAILKHSYELNGSLADSLGGPSLVAAGGTLNATNYSFGANQGLSVSNTAGSNSDYSIELVFQLAELSSWRRIIDFKDRAADTGFYNLDTSAHFYNIVTGPANAFAPNTNAHVVLTRDSATNQVTAYVNGVQQFVFNDATGEAIFNAPNNILHFFIDDLVVPNEVSAGIVDFIRIYDGDLTAQEVAALAGAGAPGAVPLPMAVWAGLALAPFALRRRRA